MGATRKTRKVIDYLALALTHALIAIALLRILTRNELDRESKSADGEADARSGPIPRRTRGTGRRRKGDEHA